MKQILRENGYHLFLQVKSRRIHHQTSSEIIKPICAQFPLSSHWVLGRCKTKEKNKTSYWIYILIKILILTQILNKSSILLQSKPDNIRGRTLDEKKKIHGKRLKSNTNIANPPLTRQVEGKQWTLRPMTQLSSVFPKWGRLNRSGNTWSALPWPVESWMQTRNSRDQRTSQWRTRDKR